MFRKSLLLYGLVVLAATTLLLVLAADGMPWYRIALIALFAAFVGILPGLLIERWVSQPLRVLISAAKRITAGEYGQRVYDAGGGGLGTLARTFNDMSDQLAEQFAQVEEDGEQLRTILGGLVEARKEVNEDQLL